jgi:hypothetical protein
LQRVKDVNQMVRHLRLLGRCGLGSANVHTLVHQR